MKTRSMDRLIAVLVKRPRSLLALAALSACFGVLALVRQAPSLSPATGLQTTTAHAAVQPVGATEPQAVIDGAKNPELIPDDEAYHLVLMIASAADDAPEVDKARAEAVRAMILRQFPDDVPELAELANGHREVLTTLAKEAAAGNSDAARIRVEHLSRVKAEADLRLPAAARKALAAYVAAEKASMKIYGKSQPQVVALPKLLETGFTALGYCDNDSGNLAPYCRDGCSGSRPCDKKCRRDDESCTTCGQYGVCCCLGGPTPTPTPTPTPAPPPGGMVGQPSGTIYSNLTVNDNLVMFGTAVTDSSASCSCHMSRAGATIRAPWGTKSSSTGIGGAWQQATVQYQLSEAEFPGDVVFETDHYSYCPIQASVFIDARPADIVPVRPFVARYAFSWFDSDPPYEPHGPESIDGYKVDNCNGPCQRAYQYRGHGEGYGHQWFEYSGLKFTFRGATSCGGTTRGRAYRPACVP